MFYMCYCVYRILGKGIPVQALRVPGVWGSQISGQSPHEGGKVASPTRRPSLLPRKYSWYSFMLEAESTQGRSAARGIMSMKNDIIGNWTVWVYSAVPQPPALPRAPSEYWTMKFNALALKLYIYSPAHYLCTMWIFYEPRRVTLGNTRHSVEG